MTGSRCEAVIEVRRAIDSLRPEAASQPARHTAKERVSSTATGRGIVFDHAHNAYMEPAPYIQ